MNVTKESHTQFDKYREIIEQQPVTNIYGRKSVIHLS